MIIFVNNNKKKNGYMALKQLREIYIISQVSSREHAEMS